MRPKDKKSRLLRRSRAVEADPNSAPAQAEVGNYGKGYDIWRGLDLPFENEKGSERKGIYADGQKWSVTVPADYCYIKRTNGAEGELAFCFRARPARLL